MSHHLQYAGTEDVASKVGNQRLRFLLGRTKEAKKCKERQTCFLVKGANRRRIKVEKPLGALAHPSG